MSLPRTNKKELQKRLVIGIDIGMTFTGVAQYASTDSKPTVLQDGWPGATDVRKKVPTILVYNQEPEVTSNSKRDSTTRKSVRFSSEQNSLSSWGFLALDEDERYAPDKRTREFFKLCFDKAFIEDGFSNGYHMPFTHQEVCQFYKDYLSKLYAHLEDHYRSTRPDFWKSHVHFVFSVPTTWESQRTISELREIAREVGFGSEPNHSLEISLTEAHAAAVATAHERGHTFEKNQVILVCDAGGGTTDIALLRVDNSAGSPLKLTCLDTVRGEAAGSTQIDRDFRSLVEAQLEKINQDCIDTGKEPPVENVLHTAEMMSAHPTFIMHKETLCPDDIEINAKFRMPVKDVGKFPNKDLAQQLGFEDKKFCFYPKDLAKLFDKRIQLICKTLDEQFERLVQRPELKDITIDYLVLSGGLGSSKYVFAELEKRYCGLRRRKTHKDDGSATKYIDCIPKLTIIRAEEPQLVVCKGLVIDKMAHLKGQHKPIDTWIARQSYGLVGLRKYDKYKDKESDVITGDGILDKTGEKWVEQIHWIVHKNQRLQVRDELSFDAMRRFSGHEQASTGQWTSKIVVSDREPKPDERPQRLSQTGWKPLCVLKSTLSDIKASDLTVEKGSLIPGSKKKKHYIAYYKIVLKVGAAEIDFEMWYDGEKKSQPGDVKVDWERNRLGDELTPTALSDILV